MTPYNKLRIANLLMLAGLVPLLISIAWLVANFSAAASGKGAVAEALMKISFAYMLAFVVSCASVVWSFIVEQRHTGVRAGGTVAIRVLVFVLLVAPLVIGIF